MPGLVGVFSQDSPERCRAQLRAMLRAIEHESFYSSGIYDLQGMGIYIGWTCHEHSANDCLPIFNEDEELILFISGEVFPEAGKVDSLISGGHRMQRTGLSYLVHDYEERGQRFFLELNGWFAGILVARKQNRCFVFNDRFGMKRLFIHKSKNHLYFATEAKAILQVAPQTRSFDPVGLAELLTCGCVLENKSLFRGIDVMPAASVWTITGGTVNKRGTYFYPSEWIGQEPMDERKFAERVVESFPAIVRKYAQAEIPVGVSVTAGMDSRMVLACLDASPGELPCYTFGSMLRETFDVAIGRRVAETCGQNHAVITLGQEFLMNFSRYLEEAIYRSDGYLGLSAAAELYVNERARKIAPVRLTGNWGGELLRGVRAFKSVAPQSGFFAQSLEPFIKRAQQRFQQMETNDPITFAAFCQAPYQGFGRLAVENSHLSIRTPFMDNELVKLAYQRPNAGLYGHELSVAVIKRYRPDLLAIPTDRGDLGHGGLLARKLRNAYRVALSKGEYWASQGMRQWGTYLSRYVPWQVLAKTLLGRNKFQHYGLWLRQELSGYVKDVLLADRRYSEYLDANNLERMISNHMQGRRNYIHEIDCALTIALCERIMLRNAPLAYYK